MGSLGCLGLGLMLPVLLIIGVIIAVVTVVVLSTRRRRTSLSARKPVEDMPKTVRTSGLAKTASISGLVIFFVGIALLIATFVVPILVFLNPDSLADFRELIPAPEGEWQSLVQSVGYAVAAGLVSVMLSVCVRTMEFGFRMFKAKPSSETDQEG